MITILIISVNLRLYYLRVIKFVGKCPVLDLSEASGQYLGTCINPLEHYLDVTVNMVLYIYIYMSLEFMLVSLSGILYDACTLCV